MACFIKDLSVEAVKDIELGNPFLRMKIFPLFGVETKPLTLEDVPQEFRPYPGCIFDVLSIPDNMERHDGMVEFFAKLCNESCPTRRYSLLYTIMHCWKAVFAVSMSHPPMRHILRTFEWLVDVGMFQSLMRVLHLCLDREFLAVEYNRYVPYRILETIFAAMQAEMVEGDNLMQYIIEDVDLSVKTFVAILDGRLTFPEQLMAQQVIGNFSCYLRGMILLVNAPRLAGLTGKYLWIGYDLCWVQYGQYDERRLPMHRYLLNTDIVLNPSPGLKTYLPGPNRLPDLSAYSALCCMCNICAGVPEECTMDQVDDCLIALVKEGYYWHLGTIATGIHLCKPKYLELTIDKFLSLTSWSGFNHTNQRIILDQINSLPAVRTEDPLMFFPKSKCRGRSVVAFLITHALWLDFDRGTHFSILGLLYLLKEIPEMGKAVVESVGHQLVDLAYSIHHVKMPGDGDPMAIKRGIFEPVLRMSGMSYYSEQGECIRAEDEESGVVFKEGEWPGCVMEVREFCLRHVREIKLNKEERERRVLLADALKVEGNALYGRGELEAAIECYTQALDTCPLKCTERLVTYYSNRAECYLQTNQPRNAIRDCTRALAMNPFNMKVRWRRSQAFQKIHYKYPAALDLLTIQAKEEDALKVIGKKAYNDLETTIFNLLDQQNFKTAASHKFSNRTHNDTVQKTASVKAHELERRQVPPYRGKTHHEIFDRNPGGFELDYESENEYDVEKSNPTLQWEMGVSSDEEDEDDRELRREKGRMNRRWLYRETEYRNPTQKIAHERELMEERRLVLEDFKEREKRKELEGGTRKERGLGRKREDKKLSVVKSNAKTDEKQSTDGAKEETTDKASTKQDTIDRESRGNGGGGESNHGGAGKGPEGRKNRKHGPKKRSADTTTAVATVKPRTAGQGGGGLQIKDLFLAIESLEVSYSDDLDAADFEELDLEDEDDD